MQVNKYYPLVLLLLVCVSCIEPFNPQIEESQDVLVINGFITDSSGIHRVTISRSTPYSEPSDVSVSDGVVSVEDETGHMVMYSEVSPGVYEADLDSDFLQVGKSYALIVSTPDGNQYRSDHESMLPCSPINSVYYEVKNKPTTDPDLAINGIQFYVDVEGTPETAPNYRWVIEETWRYTAPHFADFLWNGIAKVGYTSNYNCIKTETVKGLFTASTRYLSENQLNRKSLHYISGETNRLSIEYTVLVKQHSLTESAFEYWDRTESQTNEGGKLYETQPSRVVGNIYNVNDPSEKVLGYFYATQVKQKELTVYNHFDFSIRKLGCDLDTISNLEDLGHAYPYYLFSIDIGPPYYTGDQSCFDCTVYGGTLLEPDIYY